jgi:hypothetical protein
MDSNHRLQDRNLLLFPLSYGTLCTKPDLNRHALLGRQECYH